MVGRIGQVIRFCFWFACFWVIIGVAWRPPLASVGLIAIFLVLLVAIEWVSRRLAPKTMPASSLPETDTVQQQMTRFTTAEGLDRLEGTFWADFPENAMTTTVHISFCPAFERVPRVQVFPKNATDTNLRVVSPKTLGVRVDVKRNNPAITRLCFTIVAET